MLEFINDKHQLAAVPAFDPLEKIIVRIFRNRYLVMPFDFPLHPLPLGLRGNLGRIVIEGLLSFAKFLHQFPSAVFFPSVQYNKLVPLLMVHLFQILQFCFSSCHNRLLSIFGSLKSPEMGNVGDCCIFRFLSVESLPLYHITI